MPPESDSEWVLVADIALLDDLELMRRGVLSVAAVGPGQLVEVDAPDLPSSATTVTVTDAEGVPVADLPVRRGQDGAGVIEGVPRWRAHRSDRPFEAQHLAPVDVPKPSELFIVDSKAEAAQLPDRLQSCADALVLVLATTDGDGPTAALDVVRTVNASVADHPHARVVVVPLGPAASHREQKKAEAARAYARGGRITHLSEGAVPQADDRQRGAAAEPVPATGVGMGRTGRSGGIVLFFTGFSGSGKSTIARAVRHWMVERGRVVTMLDGDVVRRHLSAGLGFSAEDRNTNIRRIGWVAAEIAAHGGVAICSPIAPFEQTRREVREMVERRGGRFVLVHVDTPLEECERRDRKGLYARARRGEIPDFTGISSPYEVPEDPDLRLRTTDADTSSLRDEVLSVLGAIDHDEEDN